MEKITLEQLKEFFEYTSSLRELPENYNMQSVLKIEDIEPFINTYIKLFIIGILIRKPNEIMAEAILTGFQLGRLYEVRQKELKELEGLRK